MWGEAMKTDEFRVGGAVRLRDLAMDRRLAPADYDRRIVKPQRRLQEVQQAYLSSGDSAVLVIEGWDAAGKGGLVRRLAWTLDPRSLKVWPIAAPTPQERAGHYLQRFWQRLPAAGQIAAFDRSWYGRVLIERVEGLTPEADWRRAYAEINAFEQMLADGGMRLVKLFLHITPDEQLRRFRDRLTDPLKRWKLTYEDFRNRARWQDYEAAIEAMLEKTSTPHAPWHLLPADDKPFARLAAFRILAERLSAGVDLAPPPLPPQVVEAAAAYLGIAAAPPAGA
ncbi:MAG: UDP-galactose-lipid carrier transferase [Thalassobaculales bacterium]